MPMFWGRWSVFAAYSLRPLQAPRSAALATWSACCLCIPCPSAPRQAAAATLYATRSAGGPISNCSYGVYITCGRVSYMQDPNFDLPGVQTLSIGVGPGLDLNVTTSPANCTIDGIAAQGGNATGTFVAVSPFSRASTLIVRAARRRRAVRTASQPRIFFGLGAPALRCGTTCPSFAQHPSPTCAHASTPARIRTLTYTQCVRRLPAPFPISPNPSWNVHIILALPRSNRQLPQSSPTARTGSTSPPAAF